LTAHFKISTSARDTFLHIIINFTVTFFVIAVTNTAIKDKLPEECFLAANSARQCINTVVHKLFKKKIYLSDLLKIDKHKVQMKRLCQAASIVTDYVKSKGSSLESELELRLQEMKVFEHRRTALSHLCRLIESETDDVQGKCMIRLIVYAY
jgi:hypothetical protein